MKKVVAAVILGAVFLMAQAPRAHAYVDFDKIDRTELTGTLERILFNSDSIHEIHINGFYRYLRSPITLLGDPVGSKRVEVSLGLYGMRNADGGYTALCQLRTYYDSTTQFDILPDSCEIYSDKEGHEISMDDAKARGLTRYSSADSHVSVIERVQ